MDIEHKQYLLLIPEHIPCFLCQSTDESNDHFWTCPTVLQSLRFIFHTHFNSILFFLKKEATENTYFIDNDSLKYCSLFTWIDDPNFILTPFHQLYLFL